MCNFRLLIILYAMEKWGFLKSNIYQRVIQQYLDSTMLGVPEKNSNVGSTALLMKLWIHQSLHYKYNTLHCDLFSI